MTATGSLIRERAAAARAAARSLARASTAVKNAALERIATLLEERTPVILDANAHDLAYARAEGLDPAFVDRLTLTPERIRQMAADVRTVAALPDPVGEMFDVRTLPNGLLIGRRRVPLGVIAAIYEARPNVTVDIASLCLKSGNACVLRGGKEAVHSNRALGDIVQEALAAAGLPPSAVEVITDPDRAHIDELLQAHDLIDMVVPRGGKGLIEYVRAHATMPVVAHGDAVVHIYVDEFADLEMALKVVDNAKTQRYSVCNAVDTLLVHAAIAPRFLPALARQWAGRVTLFADDRALAILGPFVAEGLALERATEETWRTEHLALRCGVRIVDTPEEAIAHIERYGSHHTDAILTEHYGRAMQFVEEVDSAAVFVNASTRFTDGAQFGLGAEIGISTDKVHARGPMALRELTSYKWTIFGNGQVRT